MFLRHLCEVLIPNPQQLFLRMLPRMLDVDTLFVRAAASDNKLNSPYRRTPRAARNDKRLMLLCFTHIFKLHASSFILNLSNCVLSGPPGFPRGLRLVLVLPLLLVCLLTSDF